jgi:hypothetical protein
MEREKGEILKKGFSLTDSGKFQSGNFGLVIVKSLHSLIISKNEETDPVCLLHQPTFKRKYSSNLREVAENEQIVKAGVLKKWDSSWVKRWYEIRDGELYEFEYEVLPKMKSFCDKF